MGVAFLAHATVASGNLSPQRTPGTPTQLSPQLAKQLDPELAKQFEKQLMKEYNARTPQKSPEGPRNRCATIGNTVELETKLAQRMKERRSKEETGRSNVMDVVRSPTTEGIAILD